MNTATPTTPPLLQSWITDTNAQLSDHGQLIYASLKGSRLNGVSGPTSDVDLRCVFLAPTQSFLGLTQPQHTIERAFISTSGDEMDFVAYEAARFMHHTLKHNGNMIESLLVPDGFYYADERGQSLRAIAPRYVTKRLYHFYRGYAQAQFNRACKQVRTGKGLIATYRELFQGIHVLVEGRHEFNLLHLASEVQSLLGWESEVLPYCRRDRAVLDDSLIRKAISEYDFLNSELDKAHEGSTLPESYDGRAKFNNLLLAWRSAGWVK